MNSPFSTEVREGVAEITINHPPTNVFDRAFTAGLADAVDACEADSAVRVMLFHSADPDFFCMHGDVPAIIEMQVPPGTPVTAPNAAAALLDRVHRSRLVSVAAIDGAARGGGAEFATALDLRIGGPRTVFGQPEAAMGILPGAGGTSRLPHLLGRSRALDVILTCRDVGAEEALVIGWLDRLVPSDEVLGAARRLSRRIAAMPPDATAAVKRVVNASLRDPDSALTAETAELYGLLASGRHRPPMERFLAAGGQTRQGERDGIEHLVLAMLQP